MNNYSCLINLLKFIFLLQNNSINNCSLYNTRIITLYNKQGELITTDDSPYYRLSNILDNYIELLVLNLDNNIYSSTSRYISININCICAIKCINDVFINNI